MADRLFADKNLVERESQYGDSFYCPWTYYDSLESLREFWKRHDLAGGIEELREKPWGAKTGK